MLDEKPINDFHWKNKLEDVEALPGETFNKEAAWEKLHNRLQKKPGNKKVLWYWAAAACLLLALIIPWIFLAGKKESLVEKDNLVQKQIHPPSSQFLTEDNKNASPVISTQTTEKKLAALSVEKSIKINSPLNYNKKIQFEITRDKKEMEESIAQKITNNARVQVDTAISIVAILPEKKKLKVVHINELGDPIMETPNITKSYEHRSFQVKLINQEVYTNPPSSGNTGFNIFKTKPTPSN